MASTSNPLDLSPEPDLYPLYPTIIQISHFLAAHTGLTPLQKSHLVAHCLSRVCTFADIAVLQYLLSDPQAQVHVDLSITDDDGMGLISLAIQGFRADPDRDIEREECVRLLVAQGADMAADKAGWTPLHYAALLAPTTLVSYLMTHGCSPFSVTRRNLTPLDVVTAHSIIPGREDIALLLEESMRGEGWSGGRMEQRRRLVEHQLKKTRRQKDISDGIGRVLDVDPKWWNTDVPSSDEDTDEGDMNLEEDDKSFTPTPDYSSMLVFSPPTLPQIFDSLIVNFQPTLRNTTPANTLYMLARFACLTCDHTWLEDLIIGATDAIEETFFNRAEDVTCLTFWLYNTTIWLHLLQCDESINEACEILGSFDLIEEVINSVFVFIIRFAERHIDQLLDASILDYTPLLSEFEAVKFESEWSFLRPFTGKRKAPPMSSSGSNSQSVRTPSSPPSPGRPLSPPPISASASRGFSSLRQTIARTSGQSTPLASLFADPPPHPPSPADLTSFLTALHSLLVFSDVNPALITQLWSQVIYWTSCEIFNRVITRKKYLCRSRAFQINMNILELQNWLEKMGLPPGIQAHLSPVRDLLNWLQCLSSISEFPELVATIQTMKSMNPLQMRRAVRDYKYEVNEGRMTDECIQYLTQLQKDWERHRVKLGVEALRKEISERDREREGSVSSHINDTASIKAPSISSETGTQHSIDILFDKSDNLSWEPIKPPQVLGELLDSRYMLPLLFPSDPRLLAALPLRKSFFEDGFSQAAERSLPPSRSASRMETQPPDILFWRSDSQKLRQVDIGILQWVDGIRSSRWGKPAEPDYDMEDEDDYVLADGPESSIDDLTIKVNTHITPLTRKPSGRSRGRLSIGGTTPVDLTFS